MKIIIVNSTGLLGDAIAFQCPANRDIQDVYLLSPAAMPQEYSGKGQHLAHQDFMSYEPELIEKLSGAQACIWALPPKPCVEARPRPSERRRFISNAWSWFNWDSLAGEVEALTVSDDRFVKVETEAGRKAQVDYCLGAAKAFLDQVIRHLTPANERLFQFAVVSWVANTWGENTAEEAMELLTERLGNTNIHTLFLRPGIFAPARPETKVNPPMGEAIFAGQLADAVIEGILDTKKIRYLSSVPFSRCDTRGVLGNAAEASCRSFVTLSSPGTQSD
ncbi:hypothetical protein QBC36DRAFT_356234 [Triangularia setosa]|uniref:Uncharacterized protein n=1 Tax=Triangularia setosa TaxID=2587417 RepID=A0AAN6W603_9PEZI|nr:hypothetical protein QBC36DRAFT_356234 [Podospora setosa]